MTPSPYQQQIYKATRLARQRREKEQQSNFIGSAVAGSGKSTTLRGVAIEYNQKYPKENILIVAFGREIVKDMTEKLGTIRGIEISTSHKKLKDVLADNGYKFSKFQIKGSKYFYIAKDIVNNHRAEFLAAYNVRDENDNGDTKGKIKQALRKATSQLTELTAKVMITLADYEDSDAIYQVIDKFKMDVNDVCIPYVRFMIKEGMDAVRKGILLSYDDMIFAPLYLKCKFPQYDLILVDECQDLNPCQLKAIRKMSSKSIVGGFGDPYQAIMAFAGAMSDSINQFEDVFDARYYDLPICYRCDKAIVELAKILVPHIQYREGAGEGILDVIEYTDIARKAEAGDYVLCRLTAPLVSCCIGFIRIGKPARVKGKEIGYKLTEHYQACVDLYPEAKNIAEFIECFQEYKNNEIRKALAKKAKDHILSLLTDELESVMAVAQFVFDKNEHESHYGVGKFIKDMFDDDITPNFVTLCTAHKSKGLEAERVFILEFDKMPFKYKNKMPEGEDLKQERNLIYVSITRAMKELYFAKCKEIHSIGDVRSKLLSLASSLSCDIVDESSDMDPGDRIGAFRND